MEGEGEREVITPPNNFPEAAQRSTEHPLAHFSPTSTISSPLPEERATRDAPESPRPVEAPAPILPLEGYRDTGFNAGKDARQAFESFLEPSTATQDDINAPPAVFASAPLSMRCMVCNASPTVGTRPTVTMCGHLFCSEYVLEIPVSTAARLTPLQVHRTARNVNLQMSCVQERPLAVLFI